MTDSVPAGLGAFPVEEPISFSSSHHQRQNLSLPQPAIRPKDSAATGKRKASDTIVAVKHTNQDKISQSPQAVSEVTFHVHRNSPQQPPWTAMKMPEQF